MLGAFHLFLHRLTKQSGLVIRVPARSIAYETA